MARTMEDQETPLANGICQCEGPNLARGFKFCEPYDAVRQKGRGAEPELRCGMQLKERGRFLGFNREEVGRANVRCRKIKERVSRIEAGTQSFLGFTEKAQKDSVHTLSLLSDQWTRIQNDLYKIIHRKFLESYAKKAPKEEIVRSSYFASNLRFPLKTEDGVWSEKTKMTNAFPMECPNGIKDEPGLHTDREHEIVSQIHLLNKELETIRELKQAASEHVKLHASPFFRAKLELKLPRFLPPKSPHNLLEEELYLDPWSLLVATIFLNKTSAVAARPYVFWFLEENPDPFTVVGKKTEQLETYFGPLGLQKRRAKQVWRMSYDFLYKDWKRVGELHGVGSYGEDAFRMFCLGDFSVDPKDRYLKIYKAWYHMQDKDSRLHEMNC
ncbi:uncharacterized protein [Euwallacea fornicatus]|uniref:uncharacterized protein n=1 Tax=Euwallacea fornicatus TaxID=995702 RepID=UPI00338F3CB3